MSVFRFIQQRAHVNGPISIVVEAAAPPLALAASAAKGPKTRPASAAPLVAAAGGGAVGAGALLLPVPRVAPFYFAFFN